jgi:hypothetical protein
MYHLPTASYMLVLLMAIFGSLLVNYLMEVSFYTTVAAVPLLLFAGLFGNAFLLSNGIALSPDKSSNIALSACFGFILLASLMIIAMRLYYRMQDKN